MSGDMANPRATMLMWEWNIKNGPNSVWMGWILSIGMNLLYSYQVLAAEPVCGSQGWFCEQSSGGRAGILGGVDNRGEGRTALHGLQVVGAPEGYRIYVI